MALRYPPLREPGRGTLRKIMRLSRTHEGKIAAIEPRTGEFFIADGVIEATRRGRKRFPKAAFYFVRIGYPAVDFQRGGLRKA